MQVYADNAATTRMSDKALAAMTPYFQDTRQNAGRENSKAHFGKRRRSAPCLAKFRDVWRLPG